MEAIPEGLTWEVSDEFVSPQSLLSCITTKMMEAASGGRII